MLHLLKSLQYLEMRASNSGGAIERRRLSFRALDIEQIGHVYEGLLDHTAKRATEPILGLVGAKNKEAEISLAELQKKCDHETHQIHEKKAFVEYLKDQTGKSESALQNALKIEFDDQQTSRFRTACQTDELWEQVKPFAGLIRNDTFGYPVVIPTGSVYVTSGTDRRSSGTHYTPKSLTEPIVQYTLEPLVYVGPAEGKSKNEWQLKSAAELLQLKICDMACGSGAFLVQACRYMSERVLEAWDAAKESNRGVPGITPEGQPSTGQTSESLIPEDPHERKTYAMRIIAQRCLYGVDINPLAAEMAKLSLWLLTLAKDKPFEFLDHTIRCGDSLVGLHNLDQLRHFSLKPESQVAVLFGGPFEESVEEAITLRLRLEQMPANTIDDIRAQEKLLKEADDKIARLRCAADLLVAAEFWGENARDKMERANHAVIVSGQYLEHGPTMEFQKKAERERRGQKMFHWPLEFPEVIVKRGGFDVFVGNPPFMGGTKLEPAFGASWRHFLVTHIANGRRGIRGTADLSAYFFLQAKRLLRGVGCFGLLATNTISQGDSREVGLAQILEGSTSIYRARKSMRWPGIASLEVSCVWLFNAIWQGQGLLDDRYVLGISAFLDDASLSDQPTPLPLTANADLVIEGVKVVGEGFILSPEEAQVLIERAPKNADVVRPFLMGRDINSRPDHSPSRFIINFQMWPLHLAPTDSHGADNYPECLAVLEEKVKPERLKYPPDSSWNRGLRDRWWQFGLPRPALMNGIRNFERVLARSRVSNIHALVFVPTDVVFSDATNVFFFDDWHSFAVLQSTLHVVWLEEYASTMKTDTRYTPASCFDTFARPASTPQTLQCAEEYYSYRESCLTTRETGLTTLYGLSFDPDQADIDIQEFRDLHVEMDQAVAAAYGWNDLDLGHGFLDTKQGVRFSISESARREVLQRLLKLNHERYAEEVKAGLHEKKKPAKSAASKPKKADNRPKVQPTLFDDDATFPSTNRDYYLCGLVCDLVTAEPGLPISAYVDSLVIALGYDQHKRLLTGKDRTQFAKLCKVSPLLSWTSTDRISWAELQNLLTRRNAIEPVDQTIQAGPELAEVRKSYPTVAPELIALLCKAAAGLRDLQTQTITENTEAMQQLSPERAKILIAFSHDRDQWFGVAA